MHFVTESGLRRRFLSGLWMPSWLCSGEQGRKPDALLERAGCANSKGFSAILNGEHERAQFTAPPGIQALLACISGGYRRPLQGYLSASVLVIDRSYSGNVSQIYGVISL